MKCTTKLGGMRLLLSAQDSYVMVKGYPQKSKIL